MQGVHRSGQIAERVRTEVVCEVFDAHSSKSPARGKCKAQIEPRQRVPGVERERPPGGRNGVLVAARRKVGFGEVVMRIRASGAERDEFVVVLDRLVDASQPRQYDAAILQRMDEAGIDRERAIVAIEGTGEITE